MMNINTEANNNMDSIKEQKRQELIDMGCIFNKELSEVCLYTDMYAKMSLILRAYKDNDEGIRKYQVFEKDATTGKEFGTYSEKSFFSANEIRRACKRFQDRVEGFEGQYTDKFRDIMTMTNTIDKYRLLNHSYIRNSEVLSTDEILHRLQEHMFDHPEDRRIVALMIGDEITVGVVGRDKRTAYKAVNSLLEEIAPCNKPKTFLDIYYNNQNNLKDNDKTKQKTLSVPNRTKHEINGDKMYVFDFGKEVNELIFDNYNEYLKKKAEEKKKEVA